MRENFTYSRRRSPKYRLIFATLFVLVLFLADIVSGGKVRGIVRSVSADIHQGISRIVSSTKGGVLTTRAALEAQNKQLSAEVALLRERSAAYSALRQENDQLRSIVGLASSTAGHTAPIVSSVSASPYGTFVIGAGERQGVSRGNLVLTGSGFAVGRVTDTAENTALVTQFLAPNAKIAAVIHGAETEVEGGGGNGHARLPRSVPVVRGDPVVAPSLGGRPIGIVGATASSSASAAQDVYIALPVALPSLQFIYVVSF